MEALQRIYSAIAAVPRGQVATYGGIAARAGLPGRARWVARTLAEAPAALRLPWHRIVAAGGRIALPVGSEAHAEQVRRLQREGHVVRNNRVALPALEDAAELDALLWAPPSPPRAPTRTTGPRSPRGNPMDSPIDSSMGISVGRSMDDPRGSPQAKAKPRKTTIGSS